MMKHKRKWIVIFWWLGVLSVLFWGIGCEEGCEDLYKNAMEFYQAGKYQKAVQMLELVLTRCPTHSLNWKARHQLSNMYYYNLNQPEKALEYAKKLYEQAPKGKYSMEALLLMGEIYDKALNRCQDGVTAYRQLLQDYAADIDAAKYQLAIAECYFRGQDYPQALAEYQILPERYPASAQVARAQFQIANCYELTEQCDKAIAIYETLLGAAEITAQLQADIQLELAYCYGRQEEYEKSLALYETLEQVDTSQVLIDRDSIARKKEQVLKWISESNRQPSDVDWSRKKRTK